MSTITLAGPERSRQLTIPRSLPSPTTRELQVLSLVADGFGSKEIAQTLRLSTRTVDNHLRRVATRLDARSRAHAVAIALRGRLFE